MNYRNKFLQIKERTLYARLRTLSGELGDIFNAHRVRVPKCRSRNASSTDPVLLITKVVYYMPKTTNELDCTGERHVALLTS